MGTYIETPHPSGKARFLELNHEAQRLPEIPASVDDVPDGQTLVCVVDNLIFDAAAVIPHDRELQAFNDPSDVRQKVWLLVPSATVADLTGKKEA